MTPLDTLLARCTVVDLSLEIAEDLPGAWPGHTPFRHTVGNWFTDRPDAPQPVRASLGPYQTKWMVIDEHTATHLDAPSHGLPPLGSGLPGAHANGEVSVERVPLDQLRGPAVVVDATGLGEGVGPAAPAVTVEVLERHVAQHGPFAEGDVVLVRTDWDLTYLPGEAGQAYVAGPLAGTHPGWPALDAAAMAWLGDQGVRCVGTDAPSIGGPGTGGPAHDAGFTRGMVFFEGLANLRLLPARGAYFIGLPLRLRGGTGAPARVIALVDKEGQQ